MDSKNCCESSCLITPPKGFVPPEGTAQGTPFDMVCTFEPTAEGKLRMTKLGEMDMGGEDDDYEKAPSKPDYSEYSQGIMGGMGSMGGEEQSA